MGIIRAQFIVCQILLSHWTHRDNSTDQPGVQDHVQACVQARVQARVQAVNMGGPRRAVNPAKQWNQCCVRGESPVRCGTWRERRGRAMAT